MLQKITNLSRWNKQVAALLLDVVVLILVLIGAFSMRLGLWFVPQGEIMYLVYLSPLLAVPIFIYFGLYQTTVRFIGFDELWTIVKAVSLYAILWGAVVFMTGIDGVPRSVMVINGLLSLTMIAGSRLFAHWVFSELGNNIGKKVLIYGAGSAGRQLVLTLKHSQEYNPIAFIDDDKTLKRTLIHGLEVLGKNQLSSLIDKYQIEEILLTMPSIKNTYRRQILNFLQDFPVVVRTLPGLSQIISGEISVNDLQPVSISDLLGRDKVVSNQDLLRKNIAGKVVCVTGAGGSIGAELCQQVLNLKPQKLILLELSEFALYQIDQELTTSDVEVLPLLGSVNDKSRLIEIFNTFRVDSVYHAAAYKHVPIVEFNTTQGVNNNVLGTLNCALAAIECEVKTFVFISTDKAVRPTNTMGCSKRVGELILQALAEKQTKTNFSMVRFGNVLGSSGSVIPLFSQQIKNGGPITVTDKNVTRYFMTIAEAVALVIQAGSMSSGGDVFVLDMGKSIKINDLAKKMVHLSGLEVKNENNPDGDIEIKYTGLRSGEKLYEELLIGDNVYPTEHPMILRAEEDKLTWQALEKILSRLKSEIHNNNPQALRQLLIETVSGFKPQCDVMDLLNTSKPGF